MKKSIIVACRMPYSPKSQPREFPLAVLHEQEQFVVECINREFPELVFEDVRHAAHAILGISVAAGERDANGETEFGGIPISPADSLGITRSISDLSDRQLEKLIRVLAQSDNGRVFCSIYAMSPVYQQRDMALLDAFGVNDRVPQLGSIQSLGASEKLLHPNSAHIQGAGDILNDALALQDRYGVGGMLTVPAFQKICREDEDAMMWAITNGKAMQEHGVGLFTAMQEHRWTPRSEGEVTNGMDPLTEVDKQDIYSFMFHAVRQLRTFMEVVEAHALEGEIKGGSHVNAVYACMTQSQLQGAFLQFLLHRFPAIFNHYSTDESEHFQSMEDRILLLLSIKQEINTLVTRFKAVDTFGAFYQHVLPDMLQSLSVAVAQLAAALTVSSNIVDPTIRNPNTVKLPSLPMPNAIINSIYHKEHSHTQHSLQLQQVRFEPGVTAGMSFHIHDAEMLSAMRVLPKSIQTRYIYSAHMPFPASKPCFMQSIIPVSTALSGLSEEHSLLLTFDGQASFARRILHLHCEYLRASVPSDALRSMHDSGVSQLHSVDIRHRDLQNTERDYSFFLLLNRPDYQEHLADTGLQTDCLRHTEKKWLRHFGIRSHPDAKGPDIAVFAVDDDGGGGGDDPPSEPEDDGPGGLELELQSGEPEWAEVLVKPKASE